MRRNVFYDKINIAYGNRENELQMTSFEEIFRTEKLLVEFQTLC